MTRAGGESVSLVTASLLRRGGWLLSAGRSFRSESFFLVLAGVVLGVTGT